MLLTYLFYRLARQRFCTNQRDEEDTWLLGAEAWVPVIKRS